MARIVVCGYMLRLPLAGNVATFFQYVAGLHALGHDVIYLEDKGWSGSCYDPQTGDWTDTPAAGLQVVRDLVRKHCPGVPVVYVDPDTGLVDGMTWPALEQRIRGCDLMLDVGGMCWFDGRLLAPRRALVDCDPLFTQVGGFASMILHEFDTHFSYGVNVGQPGCSVPTRGHSWLPAVPTVVPSLWQSPSVLPGSPFRTVSNWSSYGEVIHDGVRYGQKDIEFRRLADVAARSPVPLEVALSGADDDVRSMLRDHGWQVGDGGDVTRSLEDYRAFIAGSCGEFSVAKHGYVHSRSGWFSERTVCFLAAGRPAVVQDTGFSDWLPCGSGVLPFDDADGALAAIGSVRADPTRHADAAKRLVDEYFDYRVTLPRLLDAALSPRGVLR